jgi:hypothetical protein
LKEKKSTDTPFGEGRRACLSIFFIFYFLRCLATFSDFSPRVSVDLFFCFEKRTPVRCRPPGCTSSSRRPGKAPMGLARPVYLNFSTTSSRAWGEAPTILCTCKTYACVQQVCVCARRMSVCVWIHLVHPRSHMCHGVRVDRWCGAATRHEVQPHALQTHELQALERALIHPQKHEAQQHALQTHELQRGSCH